MAAREGRPLGERHVRLGLRKAGRVDDFALDPRSVRLAADGFDDQPDEAKTVIGIFEAGVGRDSRIIRKIGDQLLGVVKGAPVDELAVVGAVANDARAMREQLRYRRLADFAIEAFDIVADGIVEFQPALFAQLHHARRGETLRMRSDAETMARRHFFAAAEIGYSESLFENDAALMGDGDHAAGLIGERHLQ
jgi:hypothetical protein